MTTRQATHAEIRASLGHGEGNRRVKISHDGHVTYYGSTDHYDREHDYWHEGRWVEEYETSITQELDGSIIIETH